MSARALMATTPLAAVGPGRRGAAVLLAAIAAALLAACAETPPAPSPVPVARVSPRDEHVQKAIARHVVLAQQAKQSGDLAAAAAQWQILTALAPREESYRRELADTQAAIKRRTREEIAAGNAAMKSGDAERAADAMLRALALDPDNTEAAQALREFDRRRAARVQAARAARVSEAAANGATAARPSAAARTADANDAYSLEQPLEMLKAGDAAGGLRDLRRYVDANPNDKAARARIGNVVYDKAKELENAGSREQALALYEQAVALRGDAAPGWSARIQTLKKALADDYYEKGVAAYPRDRTLAISQWEASLRFDPQNAKTIARLKEARAATHDTAARVGK